ncbi:glutathione S-transferase family protein [Parasphingorhabdus flavimaris]|uniref:Glutathione S-transferase family protein n=1 Tax=Parasphingorhabdus flavimaris TaxID=266812 RepID=A0ABX2MZ11_9SPHN|nr:glutathione S-transferase family protein [Parasphingorhabdus flavimaris]NVD26638.1 glutathione S-transferase family protein [Parasphingorhabdus flavimaris]
MTASLVLYGSPLSPFQRKVEAVMALKGLDYDCEDVNVMGMPDWYKEISPLGRIPSLRDRDIAEEGAAGTITDSSAICGYLEKRQPEPAVYPVDAFDHGRALWLEEFADTGMAMVGGMGVFRPIIFNLFQRKDPDLETARKSWNEKLPPLYDYLEAQLDGRPHFIGDAITIADIAVASQIAQTDMIAGLPDKSRWPGLVAHYQAMRAHECFQRNNAGCDKIIAKVVPEKFDLS